MSYDIELYTLEDVPGYKVEKVLGLVRGNTVRARHVGRDILAGLRNIVGGEVSEYTKLMAESREQAIDRLLDEARLLGANAVIGTRFTTSMVAISAAELMVFGTAVVLAKES